MADKFLLEVATPERLVIREEVTEAQIPAQNGMIGVLPDHAALLSNLGIGELSYVQGPERNSMVVADGWVEIRDNHVRVLAGRAEKADEIDVARAQAAMKRAEERLAQAAGGQVDIGRALNSLKRAQARLAASRASGH
ncbi:MAG TPA: F0F1 ATP synthase subunit epsilon [Bryobacteraceae bacterium]|jgi:F-type H+-transporting ATPase subunit epsilon|nr:F0F1 ATP synthase subunit epsilon [Bryobacteraceae bacterium]